MIPPRVSRNDVQAFALPLVLRDEAHEQAFLEGVREVQVEDLRVLALPAVAVDATIAFLETIGIVGQLQVDEVVAPLVEVQTLGGGVGASG